MPSNTYPIRSMMLSLGHRILPRSTRTLRLMHFSSGLGMKAAPRSKQRARRRVADSFQQGIRFAYDDRRHLKQMITHCALSPIAFAPDDGVHNLLMMTRRILRERLVLVGEVPCPMNMPHDPL